jgi:hypothetical protein
MRQIVKVFGVCTLALAVLVGVPSDSNAAPKGPTGKTRKQCLGGYNKCRQDCDNLIDIGDTVLNCKKQCTVDFFFCAPQRTSQGQVEKDIPSDGHLQILTDLDRVSTKLAELKTQLVDIKENLAADLVPLPAPASLPPEGLCRRNGQGQLLVNVYNQGGAGTAASKLRIVFGSADPVDFDTTALAAGTGTDVVVGIPNDCFNINTLQCSFTVGVDATNVIAESEETNNNARGICGPQFQ